MRAVSQYRVARLSLFPPSVPGGNYRYALVANTIRNNVPHAVILCDGVLPNGHPFPTTEEVLEALDAAVRQHMLGG